MAIRGILFDKDGTLIDYERTWVPINRQAALHAARGDKTIADHLLRLGGQDPETNRVTPGTPLAVGDYQDIAAAFAALPGVAPVFELTAELERIFLAGGAQHSALLPGVADTIRALRRRGLRLGVATNDSDGGLEASLRRPGILELFDFTAGCDSGHGAKPGPGMALAFCAAVGIAPREAAMVGDAVHDLAMGRAAGFGLNIGVLSGTSGREDLEEFADLLLDSINDLPALPELRSPA